MQADQTADQTFDLPRWSVAQIFSNRSSRIRAEIEKQNRGTFQPTFARRWIADGKLSSRETALMPGYLFFQTGKDDWGAVSALEGVIRVLNCEGLSSAVSGEEMFRMVVDDASGRWNQFCDVRTPRRSRKSRPSRRARVRLARAARSALKRGMGGE